MIPVYNEGGNIPALFTELKKSIGSGSEILICYDFEEDNTLPEARKYQADFPKLRFVKNQFGSGCLGAIKSGFKEASGPAVLVMMADLSDDLSSVSPMMNLFEEGCAVVAASRYTAGGRQIGGPPVKKFLSKIAGLSLHYFTGLPSVDPTNNFKLYAKSFLEKTRIESDGGFELGLELTVKAYLSGSKVGECPTVWRDRTAGVSRFQFKKWLPKYLRWYLYAVKGRFFKK